ncbi:MAG: class B sortase [Coriobacteriales bacterium]|jgi:sortase B|nr:class B sortase [Coriobacteriales bacterium]
MPKHAHTAETTVKGGLLSRLLLIFGSILLVVAVLIGGYIVWQYLDAQNRYSNLQSVAGLELTTSQSVVDPNLQVDELSFDWEALSALNPDVVGWIIVPGTNINYPIVQGTNNDYYLYHLFDSSSSGTGAIFADYEGSATLTGQHNIIYGHNMFDGSMFSDMLMYTNQGYFDEHRRIYVCTPEANYELSAAAAINVAADAPLREFAFADQESFTAFVRQTLASPVTAAQDIEDRIAEAGSLYSFVTCETFDASRRIILCAVPTRTVDLTDVEL